jgi:hypothetical protein
MSVTRVRSEVAGHRGHSGHSGGNRRRKDWTSKSWTKKSSC